MRFARTAGLATAVAAVVAAGCSGRQDPTTESDAGGPRDGSITVTESVGHAFDHRLLGSNVPAWLGSERLGDPVLHEHLETLGVPVIRMPGGSWSNHYDWLGCQLGDESSCFWPWAAKPTDFLALLEATDTEGMWTVRFNGTAEEAAALVAFTNGEVGDTTTIGVDREGRDWFDVDHWASWRTELGFPAPVDIGWWEIGNEIFGAVEAAGPECAEFGWEEVWTCDGTEYVVGDDAGRDGYLDFHAAMTAVDPDIRVGAVGVGSEGSWGDWDREVLGAAADEIDFYVLHQYGFGGRVDEGDVDDALGRAAEMVPPLVSDARALVDEARPDGDIELAMTEYNLVAFLDGDEDALMTRAVNMLYLADTIGQLARGGVAVANHWNIMNGRGETGTDYGLIDGATGEPYPSYYAVASWSGIEGRLADVARSESVDDRLTAYATRRDDGGLSLLVVNAADRPLEMAVDIAGDAMPLAARADVVEATDPLATTVSYNGAAEPSADLSEPSVDLGIVNGSFTNAFPPYSITVVHLDPVSAASPTP